MFGVYLLRMTELTGDSDYLLLWAQQYGAFQRLCQDQDELFYRHAWDAGSGANIPEEAVYWARGNSWVLVSAAEALHALPEGDALHDFLPPILEDHAAAVRAWQEPDDGLWHTVLNEPEGEDPANYTETSAAALVAYAWMRAGDAGALQGEAWQTSLVSAVQGLVGRVEEYPDGSQVVVGTSTGTNPGDYDDYVGVAQIDGLMLGVGAVVMALAEADGRPLDADAP